MDVLISLLLNIKPQSLYCISAENCREILQFLFCWKKKILFLYGICILKMYIIILY